MTDLKNWKYVDDETMRCKLCNLRIPATFSEALKHHEPLHMHAGVKVSECETMRISKDGV